MIFGLITRRDQYFVQWMASAVTVDVIKLKIHRAQRKHIQILYILYMYYYCMFGSGLAEWSGRAIELSPHNSMGRANKVMVSK